MEIFFVMLTFSFAYNYFYSQLSCKITVIWSVLRVHIVPIRERAAGVTVLVKLNVAYLAILW